jgi:hypothetical protein
VPPRRRLPPARSSSPRASTSLLPALAALVAALSIRQSARLNEILLRAGLALRITDEAAEALGVSPDFATVACRRISSTARPRPPIESSNGWLLGATSDARPAFGA